MKRKSAALLLLVILVVMFFTLSSSACAPYSYSGGEDDESKYLNSINTTDDIENLVTTDERLVINYFDAYLWTVYFSETGSIEHMVYIYEFDSPNKAQKMLKTRVEELERNKTMTVKSAKAVESYIVVDLIDISFTNVTRDMLEYNFSMLIVY